MNVMLSTKLHIYAGHMDVVNVIRKDIMKNREA